MNPVLSSSFIAVSGVIIAALITYLQNLKTVKSQRQSVETIMLQGYATKLIEERNKRYPDIYYILSEFVKDYETGHRNIGRQSVDLIRLLDFKKKIEQIDSNHGLFFTSDLAEKIYALREYICNFIVENQNTDLFNKNFEKQISQLDKLIQVVEISLKSNIGVFVDEFKDAAGKHRIQQYADAAKFYNTNTNK